MVELKAKLRRWGNSFGIVVPQRIVVEEKVKEGDEITILFKKENVLKEVFGALREWKINTQKVKDDLRREEKEAWKRKWGK